jgi:hypothetical protein
MVAKEKGIDDEDLIMYINKNTSTNSKTYTRKS